MYPTPQSPDSPVYPTPPSPDSAVYPTPRSPTFYIEKDSAVLDTPGSLFTDSFTQQSIHTGIVYSIIQKKVKIS